MPVVSDKFTQAMKHRRDRSGYVVNHGFFDEWTSDSAYVLGYMFADACLLKNPAGERVLFTYHCKDFSIVEYLKMVFQTEAPIALTKRGYYSLRFTSWKMSKKLEDLGFTYKARRKFPKVPSKFLADFVRGYFDGDGCIRVESGYMLHKKLRIDFTGNDLFIPELRQKISTAIGCGQGSLKVKTGSNCIRIQWAHQDSILIGNWMYTGKGFCLNRKREIFQSGKDIPLFKPGKKAVGQDLFVPWNRIQPSIANEVLI